MKTAIIGVDAKIQINGALLQICSAFSSALPSAKIAAERLSSCFKDLGKQFVCRIKTLKTSRRQFKRIRMKMFFREKQHEIFSAKQGCSQVNDNRKAAKLRRLYHRCADWDCPKSAGVGGWRACGRCKWRRSCKTPVGCGYAWMVYGIMTR